MASIIPNTQETLGDDSLSQVRSLLGEIFQPDDLILIRPIETWTENRKKLSRTNFKETENVCLDGQHEKFWLQHHLKNAEVEHTNLFYGVCPRFGGGGKYDKAWQIRIVRCLWADLDDCNVMVALQRCDAGEIPQPSAIVSSGNGVHLYWFLNEPYLIDDVGDPPAIEKEWVEINGKNLPIEFYVDEDGDKVYLKNPTTVKPIASNRPSLSPKAVHLQDILGGVANEIGGDHTTDLSRLLRVPGSLNRKNERNGETPKACELIECEPSRRYDIDEFEAFAVKAPSAKKRAELAKVCLPHVRSKLSGRKLINNLNERVTRCGIAQGGFRSEADFGLCCFAIREGISRDEIWSQVQNVGKFAERGEDYFDLTWAKADDEVRTEIYSNQMQKMGYGPEAAPDPGLWIHSRSGGVSGNVEFGDLDFDDMGKPVINIDPVKQPVEDLMTDIRTALQATDVAYARAGQLTLISGERVLTVTSPSELPGILNSFVEFKDFGSDGPPKFTPLPDKYAKTWLNRLDELANFRQIEVLTRNPVYGLDWELAAPGFNPGTGIYYMGTPIVPIQEVKLLDELLADFCFLSGSDRANYVGMLLTMLLVPHFIGAKPMALFNGNQPGLGKTILAQIIAVLRGGKSVPTISYNRNDEEFEKRLGAAVRNGQTTIIIDNAKGAGGGGANIDSPCLERSITDETLSYRLLGQSSTISAENSHIFCLTANTPNVSRDLITRSVLINLEHEGDPRKRQFSIADPEQYAIAHRVALLGELAGMVERWKTEGRPLGTYESRFNKKDWAKVIGGILDLAGIRGFLENANDAMEFLDPVQMEMAQLVKLMVEGKMWGGKSATELVCLANKHNLFTEPLGIGGQHSKGIRMGILLSRFVGKKFHVNDADAVVFSKGTSGNSTWYTVNRDVSGCSITHTSVV